MNATARYPRLRLTGKILLALFALLYSVYVLLGYFYLPGKLKTLTEQDATQLLGHKVAVAEYAYNPFTFTLTSREFAIADEPDRPLLAWQRLEVNLGFWASLWNRHLVLEEIRLSAPAVSVHQNAFGFNFDPLVERLSGGESDPDAEGGEPLGLSIGLLAIERGDALYRNTAGSVDADAKINDLSVTFNDLYIATGGEAKNPFNISARLPDGGSVNLSGQYRIEPLVFDVQLQAREINLVEFADFLRNQLHADLTRGTASLEAALRIQKPAGQQATEIRVTGAQLQLDQLALDDAIDEPPLLRLESLTLGPVQADLTGQTLNLGQLAIKGLEVHQHLAADGSMRYQALLPETSQPDPEPARSSEPWAIRLAAINLNDSAIHLSDHSVSPAVDWSVESIDANLGPLDLTGEQTAELSLQAQLNETPLEVTGRIQPTAVTAELDYQLAPLALAPITPYLSRTTHAAITQGTLQSQGRISLNTAPELALTVNTDTSVQALQLNNQKTNGEFIQLERLSLEGGQFQLSPLKLGAEHIRLQAPKLTLVRDDPANWQSLVRESADETASTDAEPSAPAQPLNYRLGAFSLSQGQVSFRDQLVEPAFVSSVDDIELSVKGLSSSGDDPAEVSLDARVGQHAPLNASGQLALADAQRTHISGQLKGFELASASAYTGTYIGYDVGQGSLNYQFDYQLENNRLKGRNDILAEQFYLGDKVASEQAIKAPVKLGLTLLRNLDGDVALDLDISGDVSDPSFSLPGLIARAFVNIVVKAAASPFTMLGSLVGGGDDLGKISFAPGSTELTDKTQNKLDQLNAALDKKPELTLIVRGNADPKQDNPALARQRLLAELTPEDSKTTDLAQALEDNVFLKALKNRYRQTGDSSFSDRVGALRDKKDLDKKTAEQEVARKVFDELADSIDITGADTLALARARGEAIYQYLNDRGQQQIKRSAAHSAILDSTNVELDLTTE